MDLTERWELGVDDGTQIGVRLVRHPRCCFADCWSSSYLAYLVTFCMLLQLFLQLLNLSRQLLTLTSQLYTLQPAQVTERRKLSGMYE